MYKKGQALYEKEGFVKTHCCFFNNVDWGQRRDLTVVSSTDESRAASEKRAPMLLKKQIEKALTKRAHVETIILKRLFFSRILVCIVYGSVLLPYRPHHYHYSS